jgi:chitin disaccharide deacetylase
MVGAPAATDAVARARRLPGLRVGLHLVLIDGRPVLPPAELRGLMREDGAFDENQVRAGFRYFLALGIRKQLAAEIRAQFDAFRATGLPLDHVNAHKHMHLHPTVARLMVEIGRDYGMRAVRLPAEPMGVLRRASPSERLPSPPPGFAVAALRRRLRSAGITCNDHLFGIAWSGGMTEERLLRLLPCLPEGISEIYFHPAAENTKPMARSTQGYCHADELAALLSPAVCDRIRELGIELVSYGDLAAVRQVGSDKCPIRHGRA